MRNDRWWRDVMTKGKIARRPLASRGTNWAKTTAQWLAEAGFRPNQISILSFVCASVAGGAFIGAGLTTHVTQAMLFLGAAAFIQLRLLCNLFDGMVAIEGGRRTKSGEIYNELPDRFSDAVILICAGYAVPASENLHLLGWLAASLSIITAYVRALGASAGSAQYFVGPMAKPQRMALLSVVCVAMSVLAFAGKPIDLIHPALAVVVIGCLLTIARRVWLIVRELESR